VVPGLDVVTVALFVGFGLLIGVLFGFFGMGGSILVTPALLLVGYPATVAVGTGLAFVFGTSVVGALRHRAYGQIDYRLAALLTLGTTGGIEIGKRAVFLLDALDSAAFVVNAVYVVLLGATGVFVLWDIRTGGTGTDGTRADDTNPGPHGVAAKVQAINLPPMVSVHGGAAVSMWIVLTVGVGIGVLSGCLGVGGGFLLLPVMITGFGVPAGVAAGTSVLQIAVSGAFGTFVFALSNAVDVPAVAALLGGSALGARVGAGATRLVDEADVRRYFASVLLAGSVAAASSLVSHAFGVEELNTAGALLLFGTASLVSAAIVRSSVETLGKDRERGPPLAH